MTQPRVANPYKLAPAGITAMMQLEASFETGGLDPLLVELIKLRASQINQCAACLQMHVVAARKHGETEMRLHMLAGWRESSLYSERERAALAWTEALTRVSETHAPDADYAALKAAFTEAEQVQVTLVIGAINAWNRIGVGFRVAPNETAGAAAG